MKATHDDTPPGVGAFAQALAEAERGTITTTRTTSGHTRVTYDHGYTVHSDGAGRAYAVEHADCIWHRPPGR
jgi:hypothetical protein